MQLIVRCGSLALLAALASCARQATSANAATAAQGQPLAAYLEQRLIITPAGAVRGDSLGWVQRLGGAQATLRQIDSAIAGALADRSLGRGWFLPADLVRSYERNRSYATDPTQLAIGPLRPSAFVAMSRYGDPLASQLRTMIALHEGARFVLLPVEARFEKNGLAGRGALRIVVVDARTAESRWVGEVKGDTSSAPARAVASLGARLADLFLAP